MRQGQSMAVASQTREREHSIRRNYVNYSY